MDRTNLSRWLIPLPAVLFAFFPLKASAEQGQRTWTCSQSSTIQWTMQQPLADYQAGLRPNWSDCLAWQNGEPANYVWSYGASVTTTTSSTTILATTTLPATSSSTSSTTTTSEPIAKTTTTQEQSTTTLLPASTSTSTLLEETSTSTSTTQLTTSTTSSTTTTTVLVPTQTTTTTLFVPVATSTTLTPTPQPLPQQEATAPMPQIETTLQTLPTTTVRLETTTSLETFVTSLPMLETSTTRATLETIKPKTNLLPAKELPTTTKASDQTTEPAKPATTLPADASGGVLSPVSVATLPAIPVANPKATELIGTLMKDKKDDAPQPIDQKVFVEVIRVLSVATPEQIVAIVGEIVQSDLSRTQSLELATTPAVLEVITETQAEQVFEKIVPELLSDQEAEQFIEAVQDAPTKVKKAFEKTLDIFGSQFENYVAVGSSIPVSQRRSLVAVGSLMTMLPPPVKRFR